MSSFDTNPFADPMDVNPFQVEPASQFSPVPKATARASFAGAERRGVGETAPLPNGRMGSEGWPFVGSGGRDLQQVDQQRGRGAVAWREVVGPCSSLGVS